MKEYRLTDWLPTTKKEVELRGWDELDVILFSGDAYVDHPSFGAAVIGRILEAEGLKVAIIPQPNWRDDLRDFRKLGRPRLFFGISAGSMDSMVNKYTANKRLRSEDAYTPAIKAICEAPFGETLEIIMNHADAFQDLKEYLSEQSIGFREIYDGEQMTLQFTINEKF